MIISDEERGAERNRASVSQVGTGGRGFVRPWPAQVPTERAAPHPRAVLSDEKDG